MRVGPTQARVLKWVCSTGGRFWTSEIAITLEMTYQSADSAVRKLLDKGFIELVREPRMGLPNLYQVTEKGRLWQTNFSN